MKKDFETKFTGWAFIVAALFLAGGYLLSSHQIGEYVVADDFAAVNKNLWYWMWMYRVHIFGWVILGAAMFSFSSLMSKSSSKVIMSPATGLVIVGTFTLALGFAFYYSFGAWGIGQVDGKNAAEVQTFMDQLAPTNHYATCLVRFGRIFSGAGFFLLGIGLVKWKIVNPMIGWFSLVMGLTTMLLILFIHDNFTVYLPLFFLKTIWLVMMGVTLLKNGINLAEKE